MQPPRALEERESRWGEARLVVDAALELGGTPIDKLNGASTGTSYCGEVAEVSLSSGSHGLELLLQTANLAVLLPSRDI